MIESDLLKKIFAAMFYGISSFLIMVVNKTVLTHYQFPSFQVLGLGQMVATVIILGTGKMFGAVSFPELSLETFRQVWEQYLKMIITSVEKNLKDSSGTLESLIRLRVRKHYILNQKILWLQLQENLALTCYVSWKYGIWTRRNSES